MRWRRLGHSIELVALRAGQSISGSAIVCIRKRNRIHDLVEGVPELADIMEPLLAARRVLREKFAKLHRKVLLLAGDDEVCQRLMTIPGVGPVVSLAFISTVDVPARFRNSKAVGPSLGLTPVLNQSGESHRVGRISLCGDEAMRALLYEAAQVMLTRVQKWSWLKAWAMNIAKRRGQKKAPPVTSATQGSGFKSLAVTKFSSTIFRSRRKAANSKMAFMFNFPI